MGTNKDRAEVPTDDYVCLALYTASRAVTGWYRDQLEELGLTYPQYLVMRRLWQHGPSPIKDLAAALQLDYGTLSPLLKRLEAAGLVSRHRQPDDERSVEIALTDAGEAMRAQADDIPTELACAVGLDPRAYDELLATLRRLTASVNDTRLATS
jgi:DNA-binding MarR family transcriptional regulator